MVSSEQPLWVFGGTRMTILYLHYCAIYPPQVVLWERHKRKSVYRPGRGRELKWPPSWSCTLKLCTAQGWFDTQRAIMSEDELSRLKYFQTAPAEQKVFSHLFFLFLTTVFFYLHDFGHLNNEHRKTKTSNTTLTTKASNERWKMCQKKGGNNPQWKCLRYFMG